LAISIASSSCSLAISALERATGKAILTCLFFERLLDCATARRVQRDPLLLQIAQNYPARQADPERLCRELQRPDAGRVLERNAVLRPQGRPS
jgi:hypothetical protein